MSVQRIGAILLALTGLAVVWRSRRRELVRVPPLRPAKPRLQETLALESGVAEPAGDSARSNGLGWTLVVLGCTAVVAGGAFALAIRTALWHKPAVAAANAAPPAEPSPGLAISRVSFSPGELDLDVSNPQRTAVRIGLVTVNDAIVAFQVTGSPTIAANSTRRVVAHYDWTAGQPISIGVTTSTGIESTTDATAPAG